MTEYTKADVKRSRRVAFTLGSAVVVSILFLVYAFVQKAEAARQRDRAEELSKKLTIAQQEAANQKDAFERCAHTLETTLVHLQEAMQKLETPSQNKK